MDDDVIVCNGEKAAEIPKPSPRLSKRHDSSKEEIDPQKEPESTEDNKMSKFIEEEKILQEKLVLQEKYDELKEKHSSCENKIERHLNENLKLQETTGKHSKAILELQNQLKIHEDYRKNNIALVRKLEVLKNEKRTLSKTVKTLQVENQQMNMKISNQEKEIQNRDQENQKVQRILKLKLKEFGYEEDLLGEINKLVTTQNEGSNEVEPLKEEISNLKEELVNFRSENEELSKELIKKNAEIKEYKENIVSLVNEKKSLLGPEVSEALESTEVEKLKSELESANEKLELYSKRLAYEEQKFLQAENQHQETQNLLRNYEQMMKLREENKLKENEEIMEKRNKMKELSQCINSASDRFAILDMKLKDAVDAIQNNRSKNVIADIHAEISTLIMENNEENNTLQLLIDGFNPELLRNIDENCSEQCNNAPKLNDLQERVTSQEKELDDVTDVLLEKDTEIGKLHMEVKRLTQDAQLYKAQVEVFKADFEAEREARERAVGEREDLKVRLRNVEGAEDKKSRQQSGSNSTNMFECPLCSSEFKSLIQVQRHVEDCKGC